MSAAHGAVEVDAQVRSEASVRRPAVVLRLLEEEKREIGEARGERMRVTASERVATGVRRCGMGGGRTCVSKKWRGTHARKQEATAPGYVRKSTAWIAMRIASSPEPRLWPGVDAGAEMRSVERKRSRGRSELESRDAP